MSNNYDDYGYEDKDYDDGSAAKKRKPATVISITFSRSPNNIINRPRKKKERESIFT